MTARKKSHPIRWLLGGLIVIAAALLLLGKYGLTVTKYELFYKNLPENFDGFKIVQLSDLHGAEFGSGNSRLIEKISKEAPDIIALTGDFLDEGKVDEELPRLGPLFEKLSEIAPVYLISGNHDWASGAIESLAALCERSGVKYLRNEFLELERGGESIILAGVEDPNGRADMLKPDELVDIIQSNHPSAFTLLLAHRNYWLERYPDLSVDIIICGHSHGGIVRLPVLGGLLGTGGEFFPEYDYGLFEGGSYDMVVSSGLGSSVRVPRFLNTPEIVTISLQTAP